MSLSKLRSSRRAAALTAVCAAIALGAATPAAASTPTTYTDPNGLDQNSVTFTLMTPLPASVGANTTISATFHASAKLNGSYSLVLSVIRWNSADSTRCTSTPPGNATLAKSVTAQRYVLTSPTDVTLSFTPTGGLSSSGCFVFKAEVKANGGAVVGTTKAANPSTFKNATYVPTA